MTKSSWIESMVMIQIQKMLFIGEVQLMIRLNDLVSGKKMGSIISKLVLISPPLIPTLIFLMYRLLKKVIPLLSTTLSQIRKRKYLYLSLIIFQKILDTQRVILEENRTGLGKRNVAFYLKSIPLIPFGGHGSHLQEQSNQ